MNNNNRNNSNNNRRRGRGNNNRPGGGGQPINRIDSRARGNAPQMLEKYRKLALDSHMNGDRVNEEYFLQFADHYFRVIADTRVRQEETRVRRDDRWQEGGEQSGDREFDYAEDAVDPYDDMRQGGEMRQGGDARQGGEMRQSGDTRQGGEARQGGDTRQGNDVRQGGERQDRYARSDGQDRPERNDRQDRNDRQERPDRDRAERPERAERRDRAPREDQSAAVSDAVDQPSVALQQDGESGSVYEPAENPFVRGDREGRGLKQRRPRRAAQEDRNVEPASEPAMDGTIAGAADGASDGPSVLDVFDPAILPPAVALRRIDQDSDDDTAEVVSEEAPKPRRRARRPRATDGSDEALQAVS